MHLNLQYANKRTKALCKSHEKIPDKKRSAALGSIEREEIGWTEVSKTTSDPIQLNPLSGRYEFFIADFCCLSRAAIVELDGGIHRLQVSYDEGRDAHLKELGFKILRLPDHLVEQDMAKTLNLIKTFLIES